VRAILRPAHGAHAFACARLAAPIEHTPGGQNDERQEILSLESVLDSPSAREIDKLSPYAIRLANKWAQERPGKIRELKAAGKLVTTLKQSAEIEALREWRERVRAVRAMPMGGTRPGPGRDSGSRAP
jgi:hypothetical protein